MTGVFKGGKPVADIGTIVTLYSYTYRMLVLVKLNFNSFKILFSFAILKEI